MQQDSINTILLRDTCKLNPVVYFNFLACTAVMVTAYSNADQRNTLWISRLINFDVFLLGPYI
jgi:hypothetical protein